MLIFIGQKDSSINISRAVRKLSTTLLLLLFSPLSILAQTTITSLNDITDPAGSYILSSSFSTTGTAVDSNDGLEIGTSTKPFAGTIDGGLVPITGTWNKPLFDYIENATIKNVIIENVSVTTSAESGAIAGTAKGASRIYNCGILDGTVNSTGPQTDSPKSANCCGSLIGLLKGTSRVVNCYSYANVSGNNRVAGIVGYNDETSNSDDITTMVMNCMFYGDITSAYKPSPVFGGNLIDNLADKKGLNTFNYYAFDKLKSVTIPYDNKASWYNCTLAIEERFLTRFEFYRLLLNSNKKLAAWYITGDASDAAIMAKWVLETADRTNSNPKPYPVLKPQDYYPSIINPDFANAPDSASVGRNKGGKLGKTLSITISSTKTNGGEAWPSGATITKTTDVLVRTDMDGERFNFNYDKVQLPYYNDYGTGNYTEGKVVTGWKITSITGGTAGSYSAADNWGGYNFADRRCTNKDLYDAGSAGSDRVFAQGAYWDVPYGVTAITIEPYWGSAAFIADEYYDVVFKTDYSGRTSRTVKQVESTTTFNGYSVKTDINTALGTISSTGNTVYDKAIVLVGNFHQSVIDGKEPFKSGKVPFTLMSVDMDNDHEPDYSLIFHDNKRSRVPGIRFDFLNIIGTAQAQKPNSTGTVLNVSIFNASSWFEVTNTALIYFSQFEYENSNKTAPAPIILQGGVFDQFTSTKVNEVKYTTYLHVGGNAWFKEFNNGTHGDGNKSTTHIPISVTGGDYDGFYLTGTYNASSAVKTDNAECYISGGHFGEAAGAGQEQINGNVQWQIYNADIDNFFGGGINSDKPIKGNITVDIFNSHIGTYCGGPKFGDMQSGKSVTTNAEGCTFNTFFGAGFGGTSYTRVKYMDESSANFSNWQSLFTTDRGSYFDGNTTWAKDDHHDYGKKGVGVATDFDYEFFVWTSGQTGGRFFVKFATFSLAQCNDVESTLKGCIINGNFYGGGNLGKVAGKATSVLNGCTVNGNVFAGGYSATIPEIQVRNAGFVSSPSYNRYSGMFEPGSKTGTTTFNWQNATEAGVTLTNGQSGNDGSNIFTVADLTALGQVGETDLQIIGNTYVQGGVFGGGDESQTNGNTKVVIENTDNQRTIDKVFGGGNNAGVTGNTDVSLVSGTITSGIYGGCNVKGAITGNTAVNLNGGVVGTSGNTTAHIAFGGGYGANTSTSGNVSLAIDGSTIYGNVYGGSALGNVNSSGKATTVTLTSGTVNGSLYGGGLGDADHAALVNGAVQVVVNGGSITGDVFGCNNVNGTPKDAVEVFINATSATQIQDGNKVYALRGVYGGGNQAHYDPTTPSNDYPKVTVTGCGTSILNVFGGGNAAAVPNTNVIIKGGDIYRVFAGGNGESGTPANIGYKNKQEPTTSDSYGGENGGKALATIQGGTIAQVFGGSNAHGVIRTGSTVIIDKDDEACDMHITDLFGGGNLAAGGAGTIDILCTGTENEGITNVYGGANMADVNGDIELNINGGRITNVFGGNNESGHISGSITVNIEWNGSCSQNYINNVYGGGNLAPYTPTTPGAYPAVNIKNATISGNVFGGGLGATAIVTSNPIVTIGDITPGHESYVATVLGNVFGGGSAAGVTGNTNVVIATGTVNTGVYGGCYSNGTVTGNITVNLNGGTIGLANGTTNIVFGGGYGAATRTNGNVAVNAAGSTVHGNLYGGSALGNINDATSDLTTVTLTGGIINGDVYGGGLGDNEHAALVNGAVTVTLDGSKVTGNIFGCNNVNGTPLGHVKVWVKQTVDGTKDANLTRDERTAYDIAAVYGGGNQADYIPTSDQEYAEVVIDGCGQTSIGYVYGGGNAAAVPATLVTVNESYIIDYVFGGGNGYGQGNPGANVGYKANGTVQYGTGRAVTRLVGGKIHNVFGGSNTLGNISGGTTISLVGDNDNCPLDIKETYGAGRNADMDGSVNMILGCVSGLDAVYGGARAANIKGGVTLTITSGTFNQVFGGNNESGTIQGPIKVYIEETACDPVNISELYLGGNQAAYSVYGYKDVEGVLVARTSMDDGTAVGNATPYSESQLYADPELNIISCTSIGNAFGGGLGSTAVMYGNPIVNVNMIPGDHAQEGAPGTVGNVYGGGSAANVNGNTTVNVGTATTLTMTSRDGTQNVRGAHIVGNVFGGGLAANVSGNTNVNIGTVNLDNSYEGVNITGSIFGGGEGQTTMVSGNVAVNIGSRTVNGNTATLAGNAIITGDVYGGSALGNVNSAGKTTSVTLNKGTVNGAIYGGGLGQLNGVNDATSDIVSNVNGPVTVTVYGGKATNVFGCNNLNGSPQSTVQVLIEGSDASVVNQGATTYAIGAVYGGGNLAHYNPAVITAGYPSVTVNGCLTSIQDVYGGGNAAAVPHTNVTINGGDIKRVFAGGNGESGTPANVGFMNTLSDPADAAANTYGDGTALATINGGTIVQVFGGANANGLLREGSQVNIDKNSDCEMHITDVYGGGNEAAGRAGTITIGCTGTEDNDEGITNVYGGANMADVTGDITLNISGGRITNVFGGNNKTGNISGIITVNVEWNGTACDNYLGNVYGGGNLASYKPTTPGAYPIVNIKNGTVSGNVFGGGLGSSAKVYSNPVITIGDDSEGHSSYTATVIGNVYGGGSAAMVGDDAQETASINNTTVLIKKANTSVGNVFGGGMAAGVTGTTTVTLSDGTVTTGLYGGCDSEGTVAGNITVSLNGGTIGLANGTTNIVFGGGYGHATRTNGNVTLAINGSTINGSVYGGSALGNVNTSEGTTAVTLTSGTINGSLYGGGLGDQTHAALVEGTVQVTVNGGKVTGAVYGANNQNGTPKGAVTVTINGTDAVSEGAWALAAVYGGGNVAAYSPTVATTPATVIVNGCSNSIKDLFGGGNAAAVPATSVTIHGGTFDRVFAGGNGQTSAANVTGNTSVIIQGGTIRQVFGGGNVSGTIGGTINVEINKEDNGCDMHLTEVYGGGNQAASNAGNLNIIRTGGSTEGIDYVFGGANDADVNGNITLNITGGRINNLFGGNNTGHTVSGDVQVNVNWDDADGENDSKYLYNVYGGGQKANVNGNTVININKGQVSNDVYGGGMEGHVSGSVAVNIGKSDGSTTVIIGNDVYGGGALANTNTANMSIVNGNEVVNLVDGSKTTVVNLYPGATIGHDVYGGGRGQKSPSVPATVYGNVTVTQFGAVLTAQYNNLDIATSGRIFGCNNKNGTPKGSVTVNIRKTARGNNTGYDLAAVYGGGNEAEYVPFNSGLQSCDHTTVIVSPDDCDDISIHSVYGGGNAASTPATNVIINGAYEIKYVFGGGNGAGDDNPGANVGYHDYSESQFAGTTQADIDGRKESFAYGTGVASTNVYGGHIHFVYGGSNTKGNIREASVSMLDELSRCELHIDGIYGGGREAYMEGKTILEMGCITGMTAIYGGSENADVGSDVNLTITSGHYDKVFGGNNKGGRIFGSITVNIEQTGCVPISIDELYLGGNNAPYSVFGYGGEVPNQNVGTEQDPELVTHFQPLEGDENHPQLYDDPELHIRSFESIGTVYGGGNGKLATMVGNPTVEINVTDGWVNGQYAGTKTEYLPYVDTPQMLSSNGVIETVYGGGNAAKVKGNTNILIGDSISQTKKATITSMTQLYNLAGTTGIKRSNIKITRSEDNGVKKVTYTTVDENGDPVQGKTPLTVQTKQTVNGATITGNVYGGGNQADVTGSTNIQLGPEIP